MAHGGCARYFMRKNGRRPIKPNGLVNCRRSCLFWMGSQFDMARFGSSGSQERHKKLDRSERVPQTSIIGNDGDKGWTGGAFTNSFLIQLFLPSDGSMPD